MASCTDFDRWQAGAERGEHPPEDIADHLAGCADCSRVSSGYRRAVLLVRAATAVPRPEVPPLRAGSVRLRTARARLRTAAWAIAPLAAAAAAAWAWWPAPRETPATEAVAAAVPSPLLTGETLPGAPDDSVTSRRLGPGQVVETSAGEAMLSDAQTGEVAIGPRTRLRVEAWSDGGTRLVLEAGRVGASVHPRPADRPFEVRTEYATIRVVGTRFTVVHRPGKDTEVAGQEGTVQVETPRGALVRRLGPGDRVRLGPDGELLPLLPLLPTADAGPAVPPSSVLLAAAATTRTSSDVVRIAPVIAATSAPTGTEPTPVATVEATLERARRLLSDGSDDDAIAAIETALATPSVAARSRLFALLGDAHRLAGRPDRARDAYERALAQADAPEGVHVDLAALLAAQGRGRDAADVWRRYLDAHPDGHYAARALSNLAAVAENDGRPADAMALRRRLLVTAPASPEAVRALVDGGRHLAQTGDADEAAKWYEARVSDPRAALAEAALVGLMRVRLQQDRPSDVRALADVYARRFADGPRRDEVRRLIESVGR